MNTIGTDIFIGTQLICLLFIQYKGIWLLVLYSELIMI